MKKINNFQFWFFVVIISVLFTLLAFVSFAHASTEQTSVTGIPVDVLFLVVGSLVAIIYADIKYELRKLRRESHSRSGVLIRLSLYVSLVCKKLDIPYHSSDPPEE